ncbi:hypothetical protein EG327_010184 [Venturia inaequalis]|uniref:Uncharacterized protein n=1 Tax=Venturia inaequalis TaxID=5025 RepID=A0A8H3VQQ7_VENIN|nr:hypothetical protein EG327_010184 [Venturia inaequalis]
MKVFSAFYLILPFAHLPFVHGQGRADLEFVSAKALNACGELFNGGEGFGRVEMRTVTAVCTSQTFMALECNYTLPVHGGHRPGVWLCLKGKECTPHDDRPLDDRTSRRINDAGRLKIRSPSGVKGAADIDNHACSSGLSIGTSSLTLSSSISTDQPNLMGSLTRCTITKSGTSNYIYNKSPCPQQSTIITLAAKTTYQACIYTALAVARQSVGFTWHLHSPVKTKRTLGPEKPLSEMFTIENGTPNANDAFQIVVGN